MTTMNKENLNKLEEYLQKHGFEAALIANPANITWLTGYAPFIETGQSPFEGGPALGWFRGGGLTIVLNDWEAPALIGSGVDVKEYSGFTVEEPLQGTSRQTKALLDVLKDHSSLVGKVAVEMDFLPAAMLDPVRETLSDAELHSLQGNLTVLRAVKTDVEIEKLRYALSLSDLAQQEIQKHIQTGVTELDLWEAVRSRVEKEVGGRIPILADLVAGVTTADIGGLPGTYELKSGDPIMLDFVSRANGYWGDNCNVYFVDEPSTDLKKVRALVKESLYRGRDAIRPGLRAGDLDALVRKVIRDAGYEPYPHHTGHGLGTIYHEEPRIVPYNDLVLRPGMVMVLEPGVYLADIGGVRLEDAYLVTEDGCEVITKHLSDE
jgi:Xaa-Pro dipeptidase